ncbi:hypothetical protein [Pseudocolwellia agarivorans]|jgi:hypothetical protein|uniref:hypothetical protein n=1 Tax=Pseudocolwellia agarivorans TaxID=1911682 RepID=UPI003F885D7A
MMNFLVVITLLSGSIGLMLFIVGAAFSGIVAIGNQQKVFGWAIFLCMPLSLFYCAKHWDIASYSGKMVYSGTFLLCVTAGILKFVGLF